MPAKTPKVSIIVPNYNHAPYLAKRLNSIVDQTFRDYEVLILDDASTDHSCEIIDEYRYRKNFYFIRNNVNSGNTFKQWNLGTGLARGKYIWIAESDDFNDCRMLEHLVNLMDQYQRISICYCQSLFINENNEITGSHLENLLPFSKTLWKKDFIINGRELLQKYMISINVIPNASAAIFRKKAYDQVGGAEEEMRLCGDWMTWSKMLLHNDIAFIAKPMNYYRVHSQTVRHSYRSNPEYIIEYMDVIKFIYENTDISSVQIRVAFQQVLKRWIRICFNPYSKIGRQQLQQVYKYSKYQFGKNKAIMLLFLGQLSPIVKKLLNAIEKY